jgi:predicted transposase YbfD/YdcC
VFLADVEPMSVEWPHARTLICIESTRGLKKKPGKAGRHYYISSKEREELSPKAWLELIRNHWGGIENRNHWRRDACWGEDRTRSRNPNIVGALALLRNALLAIVADHFDTYGSLPAFLEACAHDTSFSLRLIRRQM